MFGSCYRKTIHYTPLVSAHDETQQLEPERWKWSSIVIQFWMVSLVLAGCLYFFDYFEVKAMSLSAKSLRMFRDFQKMPMVPNSLNGYLINTPGCRIPDMDPFDSSVKQFIFKPKKLICNNEIPPLFQSNLTSMYMITELLPIYNVTNSTELSCCYEEFKRLYPRGSASDNQVTYSKKCIEFNLNAMPTEGEFFKVLCNNSIGEKIYEDYFPFVPAKKKVDSAVLSEKLRPNILIIGVDAVSRVNLHRQFPITFQYLTKKLDAIELLGYNKVADNTFPNLIPVFTGMFEEQLKNSCYPNSKAHFDKCPFLWKNYSEQSYVTAIGEDCAWIGLFNYLKRGFQNQTSDYYYTTFSREIEKEVGNNGDGNCVQCVGGRESFKVILEYIKKFTLRMKLESTPYFGFFWGNALSHDYLNRPFLGDQSYYDLFKELNETGRLKNTVLFLMSDHGIRWGDIRRTYQGQMEERLPFVVMALPKWFKTHYPDAIMNLKKNVRRLTTPFDLHETLKALLDVDNLKNPRQYVNQTMPRGFSLFDEIPKTRSCQEAEIVSHWCTCQQSEAINITDPQVVTAAEFAVNSMNLQLDGYAQCATLVLDHIVNARILTHDSEHITDKKSIKDYTITLVTTPGDGIFEVTVRWKEVASPQETITTKSGKRSLDPWINFNVTGTISRLNLYGKQSYCITDFHLKLYCYCESLLKS